MTDLELKTVNTYNSILSAARVLRIRATTISNFLTRNQSKPFKGIYIFKKFTT